MAHLIGVSGLSGAGKTTAIQHLRQIGTGETVYLGAIVLEEVSKRGFARSPENERQVRLDLRKEHGLAALATLSIPAIRKYLEAGHNVFIDAILLTEEYEVLWHCCRNPKLTLLGIRASFEKRSARLLVRQDRPFNREELEQRDQTEVIKFKTNDVIEKADYKINNEGSLDSFRKELDVFWNSLIAEN